LSQGIESRVELAQNKLGGWRGASGLQYMSRDFEAIGAEAFVPPNRTRQLGLFTLQEFELGGLHLEGALRYDTVSQEAQPQQLKRRFQNISTALGVAYLLENGLKFGANISRTGRAPSAEELFSNGPHVATQAFEVGDQNLDSERAWNGEIYARFDHEGFKASVTAYANWFDGFIYEDSTGAETDGLPVFQYFQRKARFWGAEADVSARVASIGATDIVLDGVADFTRARITGGGPVPRIPALRLLGGIELQSAKIDVRAEIERSAKQTRFAAFETPTAGFTLLNAALTWRPLGRKGGVAVLASANNIMDVTARRSASFTKDFVPLSGRDFRLSVKFSF
jgi:iron complex outermembrane recepter protein